MSKITEHAGTSAELEQPARAITLFDTIIFVTENNAEKPRRNREPGESIETQTMRQIHLAARSSRPRILFCRSSNLSRDTRQIKNSVSLLLLLGWHRISRWFIVEENGHSSPLRSFRPERKLYANIYLGLKAEPTFVRVDFQPLSTNVRPYRRLYEISWILKPVEFSLYSRYYRYVGIFQWVQTNKCNKFVY